MTRCSWDQRCHRAATVDVGPREAYCHPHAVKVATREARARVMERDRATCQRCSSQAHDTAHLLTKAAHPWIRYELLNLMALCRPCHRLLDTNPTLKAAWIGEKYGPLRYDRLLALDHRGEREGRGVDLANVIRGMREYALTPAEMEAHRSGAWLG